MGYRNRGAYNKRVNEDNMNQRPQSAQQSEFSVSDLDDLPPMRSGGRGEVLPAGRTLCVLAEIKGIRVKNNFTGEEEDKYDIKFRPVDFEPEREAWINGWFTPTNSKNGNLFKLACEMSPTGTIKDEVRQDPNLFLHTVRSFVGDTFLVAHQPSKSGKSNVINSVTPAPDRGPFKDNEKRKAFIMAGLRGEAPNNKEGAVAARQADKSLDDDNIPW